VNRLRVVTLRGADLPRLTALVDSDPVQYIFLGSRIAQAGLDPVRLGCPVLGFERRGRLVAALHSGVNLFLVGNDPQAMDAFVDTIGPRTHTKSIVGRSDVVPGFQQRVVRRHGASWDHPRSVRPHQPVLRLDTGPLVTPDPRVHRIGLAEADAYYDAAVRMYTEEVGVSPLDATNSYKTYVHTLIRTGRAFGALADGRVWFKADLGAVYGGICQVQGVWLEPTLRGRGLAEPAMAQAIVLAQPQFPVVSLYVNSYNERALHVYRRLGFTQVGELATVLY